MLKKENINIFFRPAALMIALCTHSSGVRVPIIIGKNNSLKNNKGYKCFSMSLLQGQIP
jgi:hypothetical protein